MDELHILTAAEAAARIRRLVITSEELVTACLARIALRDPVVEAWVHLDPDYALEQARAADQVLKAAGPRGPLHGVPVGIKDIVDTARLPTENGTVIMRGRRPAADAQVVRNLTAAGAVILGKTVTTELAFFGPGKTRNPRNPERTPGGSSSGSAAAVADCHVPLALGTQTAGSVIRPASFCGVVGFKPSFGVVPRDGVLAQSAPLDTIGGYGRTVADVALFVSVMAGGASPLTLPLSPSGARPRHPLKLAFVRTPAWGQGEASMQEAMLLFVKNHASVIEEVAMPADFDDTGGLQRAVQFRDIARAYGPYLDHYPHEISAKLAEVIGIGRGVTDDEYRSALARRDGLNAALAPLFERYDALVTPAACGPAPKGLGSTGSPAFNFLWTYLGVPAVSLPLMEAEGMPLGVQLVGAVGRDAELLEVAGAVMASSQ